MTQQPAVCVQPARFVTPQLFHSISGITPRAVEGKIARGVWAEGIHFRRADGKILIDMKEYERWADRGTT